VIFLDTLNYTRKMNRAFSAQSGRNLFPRALPWAGMKRTFGAAFDAKGVTDISRWLSEATPPVREGFNFRTPAGVQASAKLYHPCRGEWTLRLFTGGIASLDHRLMASIPMGCKGGAL
jgi:hypothetical protein